jgi:hypothetical protein
MARNTNLNVAPGGGGGAGRGAPGIKVSKNVTVKPKGPMSAKEVARLKSINAPKTSSTKGNKTALKAANKPATKTPSKTSQKIAKLMYPKGTPKSK